MCSFTMTMAEAELELRISKFQGTFSCFLKQILRLEVLCAFRINVELLEILSYDTLMCAFL